jgi:hypothetical protein
VYVPNVPNVSELIFDLISSSNFQAVKFKLEAGGFVISDLSSANTLKSAGRSKKDCIIETLSSNKVDHAYFSIGSSQVKEPDAFEGFFSLFALSKKY